MMDPRISPFNQYTDEDTRPYVDHGVVKFNLKDGIGVDDLSSEGPAAAGGNNGHDIMLPPIEFPQLPVDVSVGKLAGANPVPVPNPSSSTLGDDDSESESTGSDDTPLFRIAQAIHRSERVEVAIEGFFKGCQDIESVCQFRQTYTGPPPDSFQFKNKHRKDEKLRTLGELRRCSRNL
jgi:hypothetical protein